MGDRGHVKLAVPEAGGPWRMVQPQVASRELWEPQSEGGGGTRGATQSFTSMSTPLGRSSFISASMVLELGL
jgi:hypothetical protein